MRIQLYTRISSPSNTTDRHEDTADGNVTRYKCIATKTFAIRDKRPTVVHINLFLPRAYKLQSTMSTAVTMSCRLSATRVSLLPFTRTALINAARSLAPVRFASSPSKPAVKIDQTKTSNSPDESPRQGQYEHDTTARAPDGENGASQTHPAKQPDLQPSPERSTGVHPNGLESKAGEGRVDDVLRE